MFVRLVNTAYLVFTHAGVLIDRQGVTGPLIGIGKVYRQVSHLGDHRQRSRNARKNMKNY